MRNWRFRLRRRLPTWWRLITWGLRTIHRWFRLNTRRLRRGLIREIRRITRPRAWNRYRKGATRNSCTRFLIT
jgi:hypothetical protein